MTNQVVARTFAIVVTASALLAGTAAADAHSMGMGMNMGMSHPTTVNLDQIKTTNLTTKPLVDHDRRRFRFISIGSTVTPASTCFYKHTVWGLAKICPDLDID
jgi:hypothetical protein